MLSFDLINSFGKKGRNIKWNQVKVEILSGIRLMSHAEWYVRQAHNLKVEGSNPSPATNPVNKKNEILIQF